MATDTPRQQVRSGQDPGNDGACDLNPGNALHGGTFVFADAAGFAVDDTGGGSNRFLGIVSDSVDPQNGDESVDYARDGSHEFEFPGGVTQADMQKKVYAVDNNTPTLTEGGDGVFVGTISSVTSGTTAMIAIDPGGQP